MADTTRSTIERKRGSARSLVTIPVTPEEQSRAEAQALEKLGQSVELPGFRPGKAPADMIRAKIKPEALMEETIRALLPQLLPMILKEHDLKPIIPPRIGITATAPLTLQFVVIERPAVTVNAKKIKVEKSDGKVDPKETDAIIQTLLEDHKKTAEVERAAAMGDQVTIDFHGEDEEKKEIQGLRGTNEVITLGKNMLIPGFEEEVVGLKKGEKKNFVVKMPDTLPVETLKGKPVTFHVSMQKVEGVTLPPFDDAFAKDVLKLGSAAEARTKVEESIRERENQREAQKREQALMDQITAATDMETPEELLVEEKRNLLDDMAERLQRQNMSLEDWMKRMGKTVQDMDKDLTKAAGDRIKLRFGLEQLLEDKKIEVTDEELKAGIENYIRQLPPEQRKGVDVSRGSTAEAQIRWQARLEKLFADLLK